MSVYDNVLAATTAAGKTIAAVEREAGLSNGTISKWSKASPRVEGLLRVARVLNVDINDLATVDETGAEHDEE